MPSINTESAARRVLGNKTTNAFIHKQSLYESAKPDVFAKIVPALGTHPATMKPQTDSLAGRKRRMSEIEDAEPEIPESEQSGDSQGSTGTEPLSDVLTNSDKDRSRSRDQTDSTARTTLHSFHASHHQEPAHLDEGEFEIHEEMSQRTLDKIHAINLPQNESQPTGLSNSMFFLRPSLNQQASQVSISMSSFLDWGEGQSQSQQELAKSADMDNDLEMIGEAEAVKDDMKGNPDDADTLEDVSTPGSQEHARRTFMDEKASILRTRLQLAMFKVNTNQASTPFRRLTPPKLELAQRCQPPKSPRLSKYTHSHNDSRGPSSPEPFSSSPPLSQEYFHESFRSKNPETRMAIARAKAALQRKPAVKSLSSLPKPTIVPTEYSARVLDEDSGEEEVVEVPSSPPPAPRAGDATRTFSHNDVNHARVGLSVSPAPASKSSAPNEARIPQTPQKQTDSSPSRSAALSKVTVTRLKGSEQETRYGPDGLTSSVVKGEAASGLLELFRG